MARVQNPGLEVIYITSTHLTTREGLNESPCVSKENNAGIGQHSALYYPQSSGVEAPVCGVHLCVTAQFPFNMCEWVGDKLPMGYIKE